MPGSYFQNHNFGVTAVDLSGVTNTEKFLGSEIGLKASKADAKYIDITEGRTYSLKQTLQMGKVDKLKGNRETVVVTYGGTVAAEAQSVTVDGVGLSVTPAAATAADLATAVAAAVNADATLKTRWEASASSAAVTLKSRKDDGSRTYDASLYGAGASAVTVSPARTAWGSNKVTIALYTADKDTEANPDKILEFTATVAELAGNGQTEYEITLPPNCRRYLMLGIKKAAAADILLGTSIFPVLPTRV